MPGADYVPCPLCGRMPRFSPSVDSGRGDVVSCGCGLTVQDESGVIRDPVGAWNLAVSMIDER